jgi:hypothetical protein
VLSDGGARVRFLCTSFVTVCVAIIAEAKVALVAMDGGHAFAAIARRCWDLLRTALFRPHRNTIYLQLIDRTGADGAAHRARKPDRSVAGCARVDHLGGGELARIAEGNRVQASQELEKETKGKATASDSVEMKVRISIQYGVWCWNGEVVAVVAMGGSAADGEEMHDAGTHHSSIGGRLACGHA